MAAKSLQKGRPGWSGPFHIDGLAGEAGRIGA